MSIYHRGGKRALDLTLGLLLMLLALPFLIGIAIALRLSHGAGVLLHQERVGRDGRTFSCLKFRTMDHDRRHEPASFPGTDRRTSHKSRNDPRHTTLGRLLRKYSLDELPQLFNLLRGDMSLVGPRPEMAAVATAEFIAHPRHQLAPGLTGPFQLSMLRLDGDLRSGLHLDLDYLERCSPLLDLRILARTIRVVLVGTGS